MLKYTQTRLNDPRLPKGVIQLYDAIEQCENETLTETLELAMSNGYFLIEIDQRGYTLEKSEVVEQ